MASRLSESMELQHVLVKIHLDGDLRVDPAEFIDIFHRWVAEQSMDELLIDVADLRHVPAGPGVILVGHQADYAMDHSGHQWGLLYRRKDAVAGSNADRLRQALRAAAKAGQRLENELDGGLKFSRTTFEIIINDRALAPNTPETYAAVQPELQAFLKDLFGHEDITLESHDSDLRRRFGVTVTSAKPFDLSAVASA